MEEYRIPLTVVFLVLGTIADAIMDKLAFHFDDSIFNKITTPGSVDRYAFWNPRISWVYKWKNNDPKQGELFWGSSRWFVFLTDGWHLLQFFQLWFYAAAAAINLPCYHITPSWLCFLGKLVAMRFILSAIWTIFFDYLLVKERPVWSIKSLLSRSKRQRPNN